MNHWDSAVSLIEIHQACETRIKVLVSMIASKQKKLKDAISDNEEWKLLKLRKITIDSMQQELEMMQAAYEYYENLID